MLALMLACTTVVPLGLAFVLPPLGRLPWPLRLAVFLVPFDAAAAVTGLTWPPGHPLAIAAAGLHLVVCLAAALHGLRRVVARGIATPLAKPEELVFDVGLGLLPVGGIWLFASRAAMPLLGFHEPVVFFTAAHFHFAGFAAPTVLGALGRFLFAGEKTSLVYRLAAAVVCAGVPLTAIGISTTHEVEMVAAIFLACGMLLAAALLSLVAARRAWDRAPIAAVVLGMSGAALVGTMTLAAIFATTSSAGRRSSLQGAIDLQTMIDLHGGGNAIVFGVGALVAFTALDR
ncbi:MAG: YndJ family transporter [Deltaproteobacteria bacterium]|nr:YndJ family transporter [Deltaproteobacteria bacterium]